MSTLQQSQKPHWTSWYDSARWKRVRAHQRRIEPLCRLCMLEGKVTPATVVDHVERHFGDPWKFWNGELQSVCRPCHEIKKKFFEARGYSKAVGADGYPVDANHPANLPRDAFRRFGFGIPHNIRPAAIPVTLVCGPPAAGKSTWVNEHRQPGDTVISLDDCKQRVGGRLWDTDRKILRRAMAYRDVMLRSLATATTGRAFVVIGGPTRREREAWCKALGVKPADVIVLATDAATCIERLQRDPARAHAAQDLTLGVQRWHHLAKQAA
jgi:5-methylcytosine-specific restriction enzyme A